MAKYKSYDYSQSVLIPVCLDEQLMPGSLEFAIHTLVQTRIDTSIFDHRYHNDETGREAYDPKVLLKVVLFGYSRGLISSRQIERACKENVVFMALGCGQQPDHSTIACAFSKGFGQKRHETKGWFCPPYTLTQFFTQVSNYSSACAATASFSS
jgi:transposase